MLNSKLASKAYNSIITIRKGIVYKKDYLQISFLMLSEFKRINQLFPLESLGGIRWNGS